MELTNEFEVAVPVDQAWVLLTDVERIAPCLPGAQLQEVEGDDYRGIVKVKVGPITAQYKGTAHFLEKDDTAHVAVLKADGRDTRGQGNANATITATLAEAGSATKVSVVTDLHVTGKVAQFGRGVLADVSAKLLGQFVDNLHAMLDAEEEGAADSAGAVTADEAAAPPVTEPVAADGTARDATVSAATGAAAPADTEAADTAAAGEPSAPTVRRIQSAEPEPVDLLDTAGAPVLKRLVPTIAALVILVLVWRWLSGRRGD
ncbi:MAG TPA: SRPBCC family protein [Acidimicrobiales bacterium]|nr:SRPBCC family protein [Acidimicrobiales bacterium]